MPYLVIKETWNINIYDISGKNIHFVLSFQRAHVQYRVMFVRVYKTEFKFPKEWTGSNLQNLTLRLGELGFRTRPQMVVSYSEKC